jgi:hypothetical protein
MSVVPVILSGRQAFDPRATLFAHNEPGAWYDASDLGTMFTTSDGTTPVTAVEQAVGLILDKSRGLALGPELVSNGDFSNGSTGWGLASGVWSVASGVASTVGGSGGSLTQSISLTAGRSYVVTLDISGWSANTIVAQFTGGTTVSGAVGPLANGRYSTIMTAVSGNTTLAIAKNSAVTALSVDNISVREIAGTHAIQPSSASRPVLRNRYNLLERSQEFDNAYWTKTNASISANATTAPDGTLTADKLIDTVTNAEHYAERAYATAGGSHTFRAFLKADERTWGVLRGVNSAAVNCRAWFDLANGVAGAVTGTATSTITAAGNGWYFCTVTVPLANTSAFEWRIGVTNADNTVVYAGDGTSGIFVWGADLRPANDTAFPYQRIEAATVYDSDATKFPLYLAFDGSDDSLYTAANLDLSATDKVTVFAGVTKLSDAAAAALAELSANINSNDGTFLVGAPVGSPITDSYLFGSKGTNRTDALSGLTFSAPVTSVITGVANIPGDICTVRINGAQVATSTGDQGTGNYGSYPLYIGRRNNANLPYNGRIHQLIVRGAASSAAEISSAERYIAGKQGRAL